jgi:hypothetical protein
MAFLRDPKRWKSEEQDQGCMVGEEEQSSGFCDFFLFSNLCVVMRCHVEGGFKQYFCEVKLS